MIEQIGNATLYLGDCMQLLSTLPHVDAVITDPPYGIGFAAQPTDYQRLRGMQPAEWDNAPVADLSAVLERGRVQLVWGGNYYPLPPSRGWLCWFKPDAPPSMAHFELAWTNQDKNSRMIVHSIAATNGERIGHPTQKPLRVMQWSLDQAGPDVQTVLDPFMGSGTTGVACVDMGRRFIGVEINPAYFQMACDRIYAANAQGRLFA
jgi:site-specific DNA-methyltransferase (adenine-specific)/modification methylase